MNIRENVIATYQSRTPKSRNHDLRAKKSLPGGDTRWATYYTPYPAYMVEASGCRMTDADGNTYIDFLNNYTSLIHGHRHPEIQKAVMKASTEDYIYGAPIPAQYELAELITERMPGIHTMRFVNSGTEATMMAMRLAREFMKKDIIIKMDGGYHGSHDFAEVSITPDLSESPMPKAKTESAGVPHCILNAIRVARYNDLESVKQLLDENKGNVAGIIIEPVMNSAGIIPASLPFMKGLRQLADRYGVLLIFDEVVTFRLAIGGIQASSGVIPDITALGKTIGGGFAVGAFGAREEIMAIFDPASPTGYHHSGTFNGHNFTMCAGAAAIKMMTGSEIDRINGLGLRMKKGIDEVFRSAGIHGKCTNAGSLLYLHWTNGEINDAIDVVLWKKRAADLPRLMHMELLNRGVFAANRGLFNISTPMTEKDIDDTVEKIHDILNYFKGYVEQVAPQLIR